MEYKNIYDAYAQTRAERERLKLEKAALEIKLAHAGEMENKAIERMLEYKAKSETAQIIVVVRGT